MAAKIRDLNFGLISNFLRQLRLINWIDTLRFYLHKLINRRRNNAFLRSYPDTPLPDDWLMYETFKLDYAKYYINGRETGIWLKDLLSRFVQLQNLRMLDWGCGPGRVIRHMPYLMDKSCEFYGTDLNENAINWCEKNLEGIHFYKNALETKLPFPDHYFDVIYGISIFTHLSETSHIIWFDELYRILKSNGILMVTTQGANFKKKLTPRENEAFNRGQLVFRGGVKEGGRTFSAFQPKEFMHKLFKDVHILMHDVPGPTKQNLFPQDVWIVRKVFPK